MDNTPKLGQLITETAYRDAIHVAVAPVEAAENLRPGMRVIMRAGKAEYCEREEYQATGIVDPFLPSGMIVKTGQVFWMLLMPGTITALRHVWQHPAFKVKAPGGEV